MLDRIVETKRNEIRERSQEVPLGHLMGRISGDPLPLLTSALRREGLNLIAEIKYRSPSHGPFVCQDPPETIAAGYCRHGAAALSILTDEPFFGGRLEFLSRVRAALINQDHLVEGESPQADTDNKIIPLLRKDFILDRYQVAEARVAGASAFLLIVACLDSGRLYDLRRFGEEMGLEALVEVHDPFEMDVAVESGAKLIGVNNRNLRTFDVDLETSFDIARRLEGESGFSLVAESGISTRSQLIELRDAGFSGFLVGTSFMDTNDPGAALGRLLGEGSGGE